MNQIIKTTVFAGAICALLAFGASMLPADAGCVGNFSVSIGLNWMGIHFSTPPIWMQLCFTPILA